MGIFQPDGLLYRLMRNLTDLVVLNFLWLVCSLPLFTLGPATIAAFDVTMKMAADQEGHVAQQFLRAFRTNFCSGIPYGLLLLGGSYLVWLNFSLFEQLESHPFPLLAAGIVGVFALIGLLLFSFPLQARYSNGFFATMRNSAAICGRFFLRTLLILVLLAVELLLIFWNNTTVFLGALMGPICMIYTVSGFARVFFQEIEQEPGSVSDPQEDNTYSD